LRPDQRNQLFPRWLARRFENHPILESETQTPSRKFYRSNQTTITKPRQLHN
jgi:hypothetical protein